jgi:FKBP-type peptidyl-prolyl cis-trans isomerase 2
VELNHPTAEKTLIFDVKVLDIHKHHAFAFAGVLLVAAAEVA